MRSSASSASIEAEVTSAGASALSLPPEAWRELLALCQDESADRALLERLLDHWRFAQGAAFAAVYLEREGRLELEVASPAAGLAGARWLPGMNGGEAPPPALEAAAASAAALEGSDLGVLPFPGGCLLFSPRPPAAASSASVADPAHAEHPETAETPETPETPEDAAGGLGAAPEHGPLPLLLLSSLKILRLRQEIKDQQFQVNYRVVELESLYDVGLAVAATLDLEKLSEEILLRAVSLLDARRGALYILEGSRYRLQRTFGGDAAPWYDSGSAESEEVPETPEGRKLRAFLAGESPAPPSELLPGARYLLGVPIDIDGSPRGLLAVGDKESRRGVGPFPASDRRTLGLFANQAAIALENARLHLQALEKERLEREMQLAADIQRRILPRGAPEVPGYELVGWNRPARQIGGDYYDLFQRQDGRVDVVVGDVSGKGMPAALMVSTLHSALHLLLDQVGVGPALLEMLNRHVFESSTANKFITLLLAELEPASGRLTYLNAGHNPALLLRHGAPASDAVKVEELGASGLPIGVLSGSRFQARGITLEPGDLLCIYSDGITEAESPDDEEFGTARLLALLREHRRRPLAELLEAIQTATGSFSAGLPQGDDQTLVLLRRRTE